MPSLPTLSTSCLPSKHPTIYTNGVVHQAPGVCWVPIIPFILPPNFLKMRLLLCYLHSWISPRILVLVPILRSSSSRSFSNLTSSWWDFCRATFLKLTKDSCPAHSLFFFYLCSISTLDPGVCQAPKVCSLIPRRCYCEFPINPQICYAHLTVSSSIFCLLPVSLFHFHTSAHSTLIWSIFFNASTERSSRSFYHQTAVAEVWQKLVSCNATTQINLFWQNPPLCNFLIVAAIHPIEYTTTKIM
jgi:hypothetical protein